MASASLARRLGQLSIAAPSTAARSISTTAGRSAEAAASESSSSSSSSSSSAPSSSSQARPRRTDRNDRGGSRQGGRQGRDARGGGGGRRRDFAPRNDRRGAAPRDGSAPSMAFLFRSIDKQGIAKTYEEFEKRQGKGFKRPPADVRGPFWLSENGPFPLNPTFRPPPPTAQRVRDQLWDLHRADPTKNSVRALSSAFGLTMERTQAILRLRAMESELEQKSTPLQYHFQYEMERLMGSKTDLPPADLLQSKFARRPNFERQPDAEPVPTKEGTLFALDSRGPIAEDVTGVPDNVDFGDSLAELVKQEQRANNRRRRTIKTGDPVIRPGTTVKAVALPPSTLGRRHRRRAPLVMRDLGGSVQIAPGTSLHDAKKDLETTKPSYPGAGTVEKHLRQVEKRRRIASTPRLRVRDAHRRAAARKLRNLTKTTRVPRGLLPPKERRQHIRYQRKERAKVLNSGKVRRALHAGDLAYLDSYAAVHLKDAVFGKRMGKGWKKLRRALTKPHVREEMARRFAARQQAKQGGGSAEGSQENKE